MARRAGEQKPKNERTEQSKKRKHVPRGKTQGMTVGRAGVDTGEERTMWPWEKNANIEVRRAMFEKGITQAMLAKECGIALRTLCIWLGEEMPDNLKQAFLDTIKRMPAGKRGRSAGKS